MASTHDMTESIILKLRQDIAVLDDEIAGLDDHIAAADTPELRAGLQDPPLAEETERRTKCHTALAALLDLLADGWPEDQTFTLSSDLQIEFDLQLHNLAVGAGVFKSSPPATATAESIDVSMSPPRDEVPPRTIPRR